MSTESARERTWRERKEAKDAEEGALLDLLSAQHQVDEARERYLAAVKAHELAVDANVAAAKAYRGNTQ